MAAVEFGRVTRIMKSPVHAPVFGLSDDGVKYMQLYEYALVRLVV